MSPPYFPVSPAQLPSWLADGALLILDLRPSAAYSSARLPRALSLAVPTTLLRRPLFSLDRLAAMLSNADVRTRFANWPSASRILVYDADSTSLPDSSVINALLRKFRTEGFTHDLAWIQGGFYAVLREMGSLIDTRSLSTHIDDDDENDASRLPTHSVLRPNRLPMAAFTLSSTTLSSYDMVPPLPQRLKPPGPLTPDVNALFPHRPAFNPFFDVVRQNIELSHGITERIPLYLTRRVRHRIHDLPFCWLQDIVRRADPCPDDSLTELSGSESEHIDHPIMAQGAEILAKQFYQIELAEQRRLMSILEYHSRETGKNDLSGTPSFPFSIVAGIEKGEKNRYRHIWPFEHTRVRLHKRDLGDDYINASYVQPLGTSRRYIATQGPLPATFQDFWMLCWEQNVHVIVMLTREVEGAMVKCGAYWTDSAFGPLRLRLLSTTGELPTDNTDNNIGYFAPMSNTSETRSPNGSIRPSRQSTTIKRVFELTHVDYPQVKPRRVTHFQFLEWPDMNVPDDPRGVLELIKEVDKAVEDTRATEETWASSSGNGTSPLHHGVPHVGLDERTGIAKHAMGKNSPVLLHCSAGVGRTGGFIAVDAVLDAIRRGLRKGKQQQINRLTRDSSLNSTNKTTTPYFCATRQGGAKQSDVVADSGASSSSSALPACSDSSSSDDSFEFDRNGRFCGRYQSKAHPGTSSQPVRDQPKVPVSVGPLSSANSGPSCQTNGNSSTKHNARSLVSANGHAQGRGLDPSSLSRQLVVTSDEESSSRSFSPSTDESERHLFDGRRKELTSSNSPPSSFLAPPNAGSPPSANLKKPRKLHGDTSPIELGTFTEPIWEVVQDMREQRMSLCQSLRQYVFVHAAIVEGALMIVDEERRREKTEGHTTLRQISPKISCKFSHEPTATANKGRAVGLSVRSNGLASAILTGKRVASPTELPKENKQGQVLLSKRPSLQRAKSP